MRTRFLQKCLFIFCFEAFCILTYEYTVCLHNIYCPLVLCKLTSKIKRLNIYVGKQMNVLQITLRENDLSFQFSIGCSN